MLLNEFNLLQKGCFDWLRSFGTAELVCSGSQISGLADVCAWLSLASIVFEEMDAVFL